MTRRLLKDETHNCHGKVQRGDWQDGGKETRYWLRGDEDKADEDSVAKVLEAPSFRGCVANIAKRVFVYISLNRELGIPRNGIEW